MSPTCSNPDDNFKVPDIGLRYEWPVVSVGQAVHPKGAPVSPKSALCGVSRTHQHETSVEALCTWTRKQQRGQEHDTQDKHLLRGKVPSVCSRNLSAASVSPKPQTLFLWETFSTSRTQSTDSRNEASKTNKRANCFSDHTVLGQKWTKLNEPNGPMSSRTSCRNKRVGHKVNCAQPGQDNPFVLKTPGSVPWNSEGQYLGLRSHGHVLPACNFIPPIVWSRFTWRLKRQNTKTRPWIHHSPCFCTRVCRLSSRGTFFIVSAQIFWSWALLPCGFDQVTVQSENARDRGGFPEKTFWFVKITRTSPSKNDTKKISQNLSRVVWSESHCGEEVVHQKKCHYVCLHGEKHDLLTSAGNSLRRCLWSKQKHHFVLDVWMKKFLMFSWKSQSREWSVYIRECCHLTHRL